MYKKITHNITEEHYSMDALERKLCAPQLEKPRANAVASTHLRITVKMLWDQLCNSMRENIISIMAAGDDQAMLSERLMQDVDALTADVGGLYGKPAMQEISRLLKLMLEAALSVIKNIRTGKDTKESIAAVDAIIADIAQYLGSINAIDWSPTIVKSILSGVAETWVGQATARLKKDWSGDFGLADRARKILVQNPAGEASMADIMANGIIRQFPMVFGNEMAK